MFNDFFDVDPKETCTEAANKYETMLLDSSLMAKEIQRVQSEIEDRYDVIDNERDCQYTGCDVVYNTSANTYDVSIDVKHMSTKTKIKFSIHKINDVIKDANTRMIVEYIEKNTESLIEFLLVDTNQLNFSIIPDALLCLFTYEIQNEYITMIQGATDHFYVDLEDIITT